MIKIKEEIGLKGRSRRLRLKAHILDDSLDNPYDGLKVLFGPPYGPYNTYMLLLKK